MSDKRQSIVQDFRGLVRVWPFLKRDRRYIYWAASLIPMISLISMSVPIVLKRTIDDGIIAGDSQNLMIGAGIYLALVIAEYGARAGQTMTATLAVHRMIRKMRSFLVGHVLRLSARFHDKSMSGALVTRATGDFDNLSESLNQGVLSSIVDIFVLLGAVAGIFMLDLRLAIATVAILPFVWFAVGWFSKALKGAMLKARVKIAALNAFTQESLYGTSTVKSLTAEDVASKRFGKLTTEYRDAQMQSVYLDALMFAFLDGIASITIGLILWYAVQHVGVEGGLTAGLMVAFVAYIQNLFEPLKQLGNKMAMLQGAFTSMDRIFGILETKDFVSGDASIQDLKGEVTFSQVSFRYGGPAVLSDINLTVRNGESVAIVGATGAGKSTLVKLLAKLYDGFEGTIRVGGQDLRSMDPIALRRSMAIVPQDIVLFEGSVAFNISLAQASISQRDIEEAASLVGADAFIRSLPGGYEFHIMEGGRNLSQGQGQLIAFARALARKPAVVILDEATSSVDPMAEAAIQDAIRKILHGRTVIVIAHRLSTVRQCDRIIVMEGGRIVEEGSHDALMQLRGKYFALEARLLEETPAPVDLA